MSATHIDEKAVFNAAREIADADAREGYLQRACRDDVEALARIRELLRAHERERSFLEAPADAAILQCPIESAGSTIGPYKLLEQIGEGGFGVVFMAEQTTPVRRKVALKVIKPGMDTRQVIARFEAERQALALMDHPNIAKVLDAGATATGRPYFVMELVKGVPITEYCDARHLTPRQRLELFLTVCQAVQHAHQKGIIHRDIKPSNVLVTLHDDRPVAKVIDFGVAKATSGQLTDKTLFTGFAQMIGTPLYMSPEQASMSAIDVDTRSDVYSLGVLLYELLTGTTPFDKARLQQAAFDEIRRIIREEEPAKPSTRLSTAETLPTLAANRGTEPARLTRLVRGELDWIVMKALEKDRSRRYETANGFAMDVQRYLADEAVSACPPSTVYRLRKFVRRNKGPVVAAVVVLLTLAGGIVGTGLGLVRAERARRAEADRAEGERQAKERAQANFDLATAAVEKYLGTVTQDPLLLRSDSAGLREKLLESAIPFFEQIAVQRGDDPTTEVKRGQAHLRLASVRYEIGQFEAGWKDAEAALAVFAPLAAASPAVPAYLEEVAHAHHEGARALMAMGKYAESEQAFRGALVAYEQLDKDRRRVPRSRLDLARCHAGLGQLLHTLWRVEEAEAAHVRALEIQTEVSAASPSVLEFRAEIAQSRSSLGKLRQDRGRFEQAEADFREALRIHKEALESCASEPDCRKHLATSHMNLGGLWLGQGKPADAEAAYLEAAGILRSLVADFPKDPDPRGTLAYCLACMAAAMRASGTTGRFGDMDAAYREAIRIQEGVVREFPNTPDVLRRLAMIRNDFGAALMEQGHLVEAEAPFREALAAYEKLEAEFPEDLRHGEQLYGTYTNFGNLLRQSGKAAESLEWQEKSIMGLERMAARELRPPRLELLLRNARLREAEALEALGRWDDALSSRRKVAAINRKMLGPDDPETLGSMINVGRGYDAVGRDVEALRLNEETLAHMRAKIPDHPYVLYAIAGLAHGLFKANRGAEAVPLVDEVVTRAGGQAAYPDLVSGVLDLRLRHFQRSRDASGCRESVEMLERLNRIDLRSLYNAACGWAVTAAVRRAAGGGDEAAKGAAAEADLAMDRLEKAVAAGFNDFAHMEKDEDLDGLRDREDFRKLIETAKTGHR